MDRKGDDPSASQDKDGVTFLQRLKDGMMASRSMSYDMKCAPCWSHETRTATPKQLVGLALMSLCIHNHAWFLLAVKGVLAVFWRVWAGQSF